MNQRRYSPSWLFPRQKSGLVVTPSLVARLTLAGRQTEVRGSTLLQIYFPSWLFPRQKSRLAVTPSLCQVYLPSVKLSLWISFWAEVIAIQSHGSDTRVRPMTHWNCRMFYWPNFWTHWLKTDGSICKHISFTWILVKNQLIHRELVSSPSRVSIWSKIWFTPFTYNSLRHKNQF